MEPKIKRLVGEIIRDPWNAVFWPSCHRREVARELISLIDDAIFAAESSRAMEMAQIFRGLAGKIGDAHLQCKAEACLGSVLRSFGLYEHAEAQLRIAERLAGVCDDCLCGVYKRRSAVLAHRRLLDESLILFDRALTHAERANVAMEMCDCLIGQSAVCRFLDRNFEGFESVKKAVGLLKPEMPSRLFVAAAVNALSLAVAIGEEVKISAALALVDDIRSKMYGSRSHSRALPILRWVRGLAFDKLGKTATAVRLIESALPALDRLGMIEEKKAAMADLARIRRKGKQIETNDRHILRLIEECLRLERDIERLEILERARRDPSAENLLAWRSSANTCVPIFEPVGESSAIV